MALTIKKAAVIGSGTMGGGIAALLAGVGYEVTLLDVAAPGTQQGDSASARNSIVLKGIDALKKSRPSSLFSQNDVSRIHVGNLDDDFNLLADADWIIEVVVERLDVKQALMAKLAEVAKPDAIISTNTSGLPIRDIAAGLGDDFTRRFLGTHFFNPPRYLRLLEVIPHENTDPSVVDFAVNFGTRILGKGVVLCKDKPNFIGNRFMTMTGMQTMNYALDHGFTVEEIDALTGPLIGRPKTATFRLNDLVGFDIAVHVARNLYPDIPGAPARSVLDHEQNKALSQRMLDEGRLGNKSGQGFYKQVKGADGAKEFWVLNLNTFEYEPPKEAAFDSVKKHQKVRNVGERIRLLIADGNRSEDDRAGQFLWHLHAFYLAYASQRVPEITESIVNVDNAQKWGFSHELGPFEIWDALGVAETVPTFEAAGYPVAQWVKDMLAAGHATFYQRDETGQVDAYYSPQQGDIIKVTRDFRQVNVERLRATNGEVIRNDSASVLDMGDGVALLEFHSKQNSIDPDTIAMTWKALELLEGRFSALVVGNEGGRFSVGANVFLAMMAAQSGQYDQLDAMVTGMQTATLALRHASKPVVTAPYDLALGGGCEFLMAGARTVAHAELYTGLVEVGVGIIPASGGCKEMLRRVVNPIKESSPNGDVLPHLQRVFETLATAKVSSSAQEARELGFLCACDRIVMNRAQLLGEAKREALHMSDGYVPIPPDKVWAAGRDAYAALLIGIEGFREGGYATEYDAHIVRKLAYVLTGGALSAPQWVDAQVILDLEREAFMSLMGEAKTLERIGHMLQTNKPLRN